MARNNGNPDDNTVRVFSEAADSVCKNARLALYRKWPCVKPDACIPLYGMHANEQEDFCSTGCKILVYQPLGELQYLQRQALPWLVRVVNYDVGVELD